MLVGVVGYGIQALGREVRVRGAGVSGGLRERKIWL